MATLIDKLIGANQQPWKDYVQHPFVQKLGDGTLEKTCFQHYLKQDYLFLLQFSRIFGLAAFKSRTVDELRHAKSSLVAIVDIELSLHLTYCAEWGITESELQRVVESTPNMAYTRYVMERGLAGNLLDLNVALAPCILGYAAVADWLQTQPFLKTDDNPYSDWIDMYSGSEYREVADAHRAMVNNYESEVQSQERFEELSTTFAAATRLEVGFWQMGLDLV